MTRRRERSHPGVIFTAEQFPRDVKFLIIEDDLALAEALKEGLVDEGHVVDTESDGVRGEESAITGEYDAIILDLMLPGKDGLAVLRSLRRSGIGTPVLVLTARDSADDAIRGLDAGADDYVRKPFDFGEVEARLRSLVRRDPAVPRVELRVDDVVFDPATRRATRGGAEIALTTREAAYLEYFMRNAGLVVTRAMLETALWDREGEITSNVIDVYVRRLRAKLENGRRRPLLRTVRGLGYRFGPEP